MVQPDYHFQLFHYFKGRLTQEVLIQAGVYTADDPRLMGLETYFVENELGAFVGEDIPVTIEPLPQDVETPAGMTHAEAQDRLGFTTSPTAFVDPSVLQVEDDEPFADGGAVLVSRRKRRN